MTNKLPKVGLVIGVLLSSAFEPAAQQISEGTFEAIVAVGNRTLEKILRERPHRITTTVTAGGAASQRSWLYIKEVFEQGGGGETRSRRDEGLAGTKRHVVEIKTINGVCYKKIGGADWLRSPMTVLEPMIRPAMGLEGETFAKRLISSKMSFQRGGIGKLNGEIHDTYISTITESYVYEMNGNDVRSETVDTYFIRPNGSIAKYERSTTVTSQANRVNTVYRFAVEWEIDPAFIIAAPDLRP